jgi:hypothetical protein
MFTVLDRMKTSCAVPGFIGGFSVVDAACARAGKLRLSRTR